MKRYARLHDGVAAEIIETDGDITTMFHPSLQWVECSADVELGWLYADGELFAPSPPAPPGKAVLLDYAADKRWQVEKGGVDVGGAQIRTDEKSQNRISGAALLALSDADLETIDWEAQPGIWIEVSAETMKAIGIAVGRHVQACFSTLMAVQAGIEAGTITTTEQIDAADWPS